MPHLDWLTWRASLWIGVLAVILVIAACDGADQASTEPDATSGPSEDAARILEAVGGDGLELTVSDADVALDAAQALAAGVEHLHGGARTTPTKEVILAEVVRARDSPSLTPGRHVYIVYATDFEEIEYGPPPADGSPPVEIVLTQAAVVIDATTGDFIWSTWWE